MSVCLGEKDFEQKIEQLEGHMDCLVIRKELLYDASTLQRCCILLATKVQQFSFLTVIDCTGSWLPPVVSIGISQIMRSCALKKVKLNYNSLGNDAQLIFKALFDDGESKSAHSLETLELSENSISDPVTWHILFNVLKTNKVLTVVEITDNYIPECVFQDLAAAIEQNDTLTHFDFRRKLGEWVARSPLDNICKFVPFSDSIGKNEFTDIVYNAMEKNLSILKTNVYSDSGPQLGRYQRTKTSETRLKFKSNVTDHSLFLASIGKHAKTYFVEDFTQRNKRYTWSLVSERLLKFANTMSEKSSEMIVDLFDFKEYASQESTTVDGWVILAPLESFSRHNRAKKVELLSGKKEK